MALDKLVDSTQLDADLTSVANAIRTKGGTSASLAFPSGFVSAIGDISGGGNLGTKTITANDTYDASDDDLDGYSQVTVSVPASAVDSGAKSITANGNGQDVVGYATVNVAVPNTYAAGDEGKVVSSGALVSQTSDTVTTNDTYDTTLINSLTVNVSGGGGIDGESVIDRSISGMVSSTNVTEIGKDAFRYCDSITGVCFPNLTRVSDEGLKESGIEIADLGECAYLASMGFMGYQNSSKQKLRTVILRKTDGVCTMQNTNVFNYCHDVTVYVPSDLKSSYTSASNWSTRISGGVVTLESIEGSQYENYYADGTPVSS